MNLNNNVCVSAAINVEAVVKRFTLNFESVLASGKISIVEDKELQIEVLRAISNRYTPYNMNDFDNAIERSLARTNVFKIEVTNITGKVRKVGDPFIK